jgi:ferredoxin-NADP reductase
MTDIAPDTQPAHMPWEDATVVAIRDETAHAKTFRLALGRPSQRLAGQHYIVRLTAPDGYTAMRSYSVASAPDGSNEFELTVELLPEGEVSSFLHEEVVVGDHLEVRGPIGGWFVWKGTTPALGIGGGSGVVPIMAMLRLARRQNRSDLFQVVVSVRSPADLYYASEIDGSETTIVYTREPPPASSRPAGRLRPHDIAPCVRDGATTYICGSTAFTNAASDLVVQAGVPVDHIRVERFGPTG